MQKTQLMLLILIMLSSLGCDNQNSLKEKKEVLSCTSSIEKAKKTLSSEDREISLRVCSNEYQNDIEKLYHGNI